MAIGPIIGISTSSNEAEVELSSYYGTVNELGTITFTITSPTSGTFHAFSSDTSVATAEITNKIVTVNTISQGQASITVVLDQGENKASVTSKPFVCIVNPMYSGTLEDVSWSAISQAAIAGLGSFYWDIGDIKSIILNGTIGTLTLSNFVTNVFILHFNYPINKTITDNNIIWGGFKDSSGMDIALVDSYYETSDYNGTMYFNMRHWGFGQKNNYGGWKGCDLRYDILGATSIAPSDYGTAHTTNNTGYDATSATLTNPKENTLLAALPSDFRNSLRLWSRWIDAKGNSSNVDANIKETVDAVTLLTEFEIKGTQVGANQFEKNHQSQMEYYNAGNSSIKVNHNNSSSAVRWWLASPTYHSASSFTCVSLDGSIGGFWPDTSYAIAPAFKV